MSSAPSTSRSLTTRQLTFGALLLLALGLIGGWLVHAYLEHQRVIKTDTEPAAQLKRDDTAKAKAPMLFVMTREGISYASPEESEQKTSFYIDLIIDEKKCKDYYGEDGVMQCESHWNKLEPARAQTKISPAIDGAKWKFVHQHNRYERFFSFRYLYEQEASQSNQTYTITLPQDLGENVVVSSKNIKITTPAFEPEITQWSFQVDPENPQKSLLSGEISFDWAVDEVNLPKHITVSTKATAEKDASSVTGKDTAAPNTLTSGSPTVLAEPLLTFSPDGRKVGFVAEVTTLPQKSELATLALTPGIARKSLKATSQKAVQQATTVPGQDVFVSLADVRSFTATDNENLQQQVLLMEFTRPVNVAEVQASTQGILLPRFENEQAQQDNSPTNWQQYLETSGVFISALNRSAGRILPLTPIESAEKYSTTVSFNYHIPAHYRHVTLGHPRYFYLTNPGGMASSAGYPLAAFSKTVSVAPLEKELYIMQKGAILSLNASKTLALFSRGLNQVTLNAWQIRPQFINLLVTQSYGDLDSLEMRSHSMEFSHLSEKQYFSYTPAQTNENTPNYTALNLSSLLRDGKKGLFHLELQGAGISEEGRQESLTTYQSTFLLVTDLAMNIKQTSEGRREVFIHSFASGKPSSGVKVEVVGQNGLPLFSNVTNEQGYLSIPDVDGFNQEKSPVAIVATLGDDYTFMPIHNYKRNVSYTHIPSTAGRHVREGGISAFTFAERGIFRPGEELRFGTLIKNSAWGSQSLEGLPLRISLYNPRSDLIYDKVHTYDSSGLVSVVIPTKETDPTGQYSLEVRLDNNWLGGTSVQVEEFQPDTIKVETRFNKVPQTGHKGWVVPENLKLMTTVSNLYGTPAVGHKVNFSYSLTPTQLHFKEFDDYRFFDPGKASRRYASERQSAETNAQGEVDFPVAFDGYASGSYFLHAITEAFEAGGGRGVTRSNTLLVSPHPVMVGWKSDLKMSYIPQDNEANVHFLAVDNTLVPTTLDNLEVTVSEVQHISSLVKTDAGAYRYDTARRLTKIDSTPVSIGAQGLNYALPTHSTGEFEVSLKDASGLERCNLSYVVAGASQRLYGLERDATLRVHLDKLEYEAGETMEIFISAPYAGAGLITLESDKVLASQWFTAETSDSVQRITVPRTIEGRAFVNVALVRDIYSDAVYSSPFTYAVAPFMANLERRDQKLRLEAPEKAAPGDTLTMRVSAHKPGKAIVFAVDEGILQLTNYQTPSALSYFFKQTPLSVTTMQNWSLIMPEYNMLHSAFGGDLLAQSAEASAYLNPFRRKGEPSVVYWSKVIDIEPEGTELSWQIPSYFNGSLRLMAISAGDTAIGEAVRSTTVKGPLIISPSLPVAVAPGDEFDVTIAITNNIEGSGEALEVALTAEVDQGLAFIQEPASSLTIAEGQQGKVQFRLKATERLGQSTLSLTAKAMDTGTGMGTGKEVTVKRPISLSVRPASPKISSFSAGFVKTDNQTIPVGRSLYPEFGAVEASVSGLPLPLIDGLASFLTSFPHECTEQILSAAFPYIALNKSAELLPVPQGETPLKLKNRTDKAFQRGVVTLREREITPGRFTLWPYEESRGYNFLTVYGLDYLVSAQEAGFNVPQDLLENTRLQSLRIIQSTPTTQEAMRVATYAAWVYTRSGKTLTELPRLVKDLDANIKDWRKTPSAALVASCYQMMQQSDNAQQLINSAKAIAPDDKTNRNYPGWFTSRLWDNSLLLSAYASSFPEKLADKEAEKALVYIINDVGNGVYTTSSAAQAVRALADYAMANMQQSPELTLEALDSNQNILPVKASGSAVKRLAVGNEAQAFRFGGAEDLYWQISANGFDKKPLPALAKKIMVTSEYIPVDDKPLADLAQGDELYVVLRAKTAGTGDTNETIDNVAITSLLPGGFEMVLAKDGALIGAEAPNAGYQPGSQTSADLEPDGPKPQQNYGQIAAVQAMLDEAGIDGRPLPIVHAERREDRMVVFTSLNAQERLFIYRVKAINKGKFTLPATSAAAVYDPDARANTEEGLIEVK